MPPVDAGHVFVVHADLTKLACDYYLIPTDASYDVGEHWEERFGSRQDVAAHGPLSETQRVTGPHSLGNGASVRWVHTGNRPGADPAWLREGIQQALDAVKVDLANATHARYQRARPLLGMPVFGTGAGGFDNVRGQVLDMILELTHDVVKSASFDIAIVCFDRSDYAALQARPKRLEFSNDSLSSEQIEVADELGAMARAGRLVLFLGAGISVPAGLPSWKELLDTLAAKLPDRNGRVLELSTGSLPEVASQLAEIVDNDTFRALLTEQLQRDEYALGHALVASLRAEEVITTNFDELYEQAATVTFGKARPLRILPWERADPDLPWLLKMHGGIRRGHVIFRSEDYESYDEVWRPLVSIVQALLITRHMLFIGYSLTDPNFERLATQVRELFRKETSGHRDFGTILTLEREPQTQAKWHPDLRTVAASEVESDPADVNKSRAGRKLEIFLDRVAAKAASNEHAFVLDDRYGEFLEDSAGEIVKKIVRQVDALPSTDNTWDALREVLRSYGAKLGPD